MNKFIPKNHKYSKIRKKLKFTKKKEYKHIYLKKGSIGLKCKRSGQITAEILENIRRIISRKIKKIGKVIIYVQINVPLTKKSIGMRMGKGAGSINSWVGIVKKGKILIELLDVPKNLSISILKSVSLKLPFTTKIIYKN